MADPSTIIPIGYKNDSGETIPPFAILELTGDCEYISATRSYVVKVRKPTGVGPYILDIGSGAASSGEGSYGLGVSCFSHTWWMKYNGSAPTTAWVTEVGAVAGQWYGDTSGTGFLYAGVFDGTNHWVLVMQRGGDGLSPYKILQDDGAGNAAAIYATSHSSLGFDVKAIDGTLAVTGDTLKMFGDFMSGVCQTNDIVFGRMVGDRLQFVSGISSHTWCDCKIIVAATYTVALNSLTTYPRVTHYPSVFEAMADGDFVTVAFDTKAQQFWIVQRGCPT